MSMQTTCYCLQSICLLTTILFGDQEVMFYGFYSLTLKFLNYRHFTVFWLVLGNWLGILC